LVGWVDVVYGGDDSVVSIRIIYIIVMANMRELAERRTAVLVHPIRPLTLPARATSRARILRNP
jgi:hypothetical protein